MTEVRGDLQRPDDTRVEPPVTEQWALGPELRTSGLLGSTLPTPVQSSPSREAAADVVVGAYEAWQRDIFSFLRAATRDPEVAEDLTQETFIRLLREVQAGRTPTNVRAWLYTVASHLVTSRGRRMVVADRFKSIIAIRGSAESPERDSLRREQSDEMHRALAQLPVDARTALLLSAHGFSGQEIAAVLGRTEGATRTLLCRARVRLRERLEVIDPPPGRTP